MQQIYGPEAEHQIGRRDKEGNMPVILSGKKRI